MQSTISNVIYFLNKYKNQYGDIHIRIEGEHAPQALCDIQLRKLRRIYTNGEEEIDYDLVMLGVRHYPILKELNRYYNNLECPSKIKIKLGEIGSYEI